MGRLRPSATKPFRGPPRSTASRRSSPEATYRTPANATNTDYAEARLVLDPDGSLRVETGAIDVGQGALTVLAQIAASETGIDFDRVTVEGYDPDSGVEDEYGSIADRTTYLIGGAI